MSCNQNTEWTFTFLNFIALMVTLPWNLPPNPPFTCENNYPVILAALWSSSTNPRSRMSLSNVISSKRCCSVLSNQKADLQVHYVTLCPHPLQLPDLAWAAHVCDQFGTWSHHNNADTEKTRRPELLQKWQEWQDNCVQGAEGFERDEWQCVCYCKKI